MYSFKLISSLKFLLNFKARLQKILTSFVPALIRQQEIMKAEIHDAQNLFPQETGFILTSNDYCQEWRNEDGCGFTIGIEEMSPIN